MPGERRLSVGVIGGGSAGYLTALALRARCPEIDVTLIESKRVPIIGVGEGTTPLMVPFLHHYLKLDVRELFSEVQPTWKIGVRLDWGASAGEPFQFPFAAPYLADSYVRTGTINHAGLGAELMNQRAGLHVLEQDLGVSSLAASVPFAYHLENARFVRYLARQAQQSGVRMIDALLVDHSLRPNGELEAVISDDGRQFEFDIFVDCSGFRSTLLGGALGVKFISYESSLFTNAALPGAAPHRNGLSPYTQCDTMNAGWCWSVPQVEEDRRGYVFSADHLSPTRAEEEMRRHCPGLGDVRLIRYTPGRRTHWWFRNVVAIGNSYGFVEPLQATALHMIVHEITILVQCLKRKRPVQHSHDRENRHLAALWDDVCALIALHYRFNFRKDTPFWRDAQASASLRTLEPVIDRAIKTGSVARLVKRGEVKMNYGAARDIDLILLGLRLVKPECLAPMLEEDGWCRVRRQTQFEAGRALSTAASVRAARRNPEALGFEKANWFRTLAGNLDGPLPSGLGVLLSMPADDSPGRLKQR